MSPVMPERNGADEKPPEETLPDEDQPTSAEESPVDEGVAASADEPAVEEQAADSASEEPVSEEIVANAEETAAAEEALASAEEPATEEPVTASVSEAPAEEAASEEEEAPKKKAKAKPRSKKASATATLPTTDEELFQKGRSWYVVHTYSGYEDKVRTNLEQRIKSMDAEGLVFRVVVPSVDEMEIRDGQRRTVPKKIFPGYVLVEMITLRDEDTKANEQEMAESNKAWMVVRNSPGVTGFVGSGTAPTALDKTEVQAIMKQMRAEEPVVKVGFTVGQSVRVTDGPFADFVGVVDEINIEKGKVKVLVSMMGRETPVELDFLQVERL